MPSGAAVNIGADASGNTIGLSAPVAGFEYLNFFGDNSAKTIRNQVLGKPKPTVVGAPGVSAGFISTSAGNYIETGISDLVEVSLLAVVRAAALVNASTWGFIIGNYAGTDFPGSSLTFLQSSQVLLATLSGRSNGSGGVTQSQTNATAASDKNAWAFVEARIGLSRQSVRDWTRNVGGQSTPTAARVASGRTYRIGSNTGAAQGALDISFAAIAPRVLSDTEMGLMYAWVKDIEAGKGKTL